MPIDVSVVIVNFNTGPSLATTLDSLPPGLRGVEWEAVVVDNHSSDFSQRAAEATDPRVRLLRQSANVGFARGVNAGIAATSAPLVLILNPDCQLGADAVTRLSTELAPHPSCAIIGPRILDPAGTLQASARGDPTLFTGLFGRTTALSGLFPSLPVVKRNLTAEAALRSGQSSVVVDWVSGACMLARRDALGSVGGFDERYFLYWEDADLCRRLRRSGWHVRYMPGAVAIHEVGQSSRNVRALANREFHRSAYRYYVTHVVPQRWHPGRPLAWLILRARALVSRSLPSARRPRGPRGQGAVCH
jgi:GT2 family glycosyltransferase